MNTVTTTTTRKATRKATRTATTPKTKTAYALLVKAMAGEFAMKGQEPKHCRVKKFYDRAASNHRTDKFARVLSRAPQMAADVAVREAVTQFAAVQAGAPTMQNASGWQRAFYHYALMQATPAQRNKL